MAVCGAGTITAIRDGELAHLPGLFHPFKQVCVGMPTIVNIQYVHDAYLMQTLYTFSW